MKQHITIDQLNELSHEGRERLRDWVYQTYVVPLQKEDARRGGFVSRDFSNTLLLSIGQMIEFLGEDYYRWFIRDYYDGEDCPSYYEPGEICDALWEKTKERLEE